MPLSYVDDISDGSGPFIFMKILCRWKGSLYKLVWVDLSMYLGIYYSINLVYRFILPQPQKQTFEYVVQFCENMKGNIPVSFLLGFFVSGVIGRWYQMYMHIPWVNHIAYSTTSFINCADKSVSKAVRLSLMRYINLAWILLMRRISDQIADRFKQVEQNPEDKAAEGCCVSQCCRPQDKQKRQYATRHAWSISQFQNTLHSAVPPPKSPIRQGMASTYRQTSVYRPLEDSASLPSPDEPGEDIFHAFEGDDEWSIRGTLQGFNKDRKIRETFGKIITESEIKAFEAVAKQYFKITRQRYLPEYWVPIQWAVRLIQKAGLHGNIPDPRMIGAMFKELGEFRLQLQKLQVFCSIMMPLVYTQVVIIAVYSYFACEILASQFIEVPKAPGDPVVDFVFPIFSVFYFLFLMGWLKVALCVMNPFGDDDEDFETSDILDYNLDVSYRSVILDESSFPEALHAATFAVKTMKGADDDNLLEYVENTIEELEKVEQTIETNELTNLELRRRCCKCTRSSSRSKRNHPGKQPSDTGKGFNKSEQMCAVPV